MFAAPPSEAQDGDGTARAARLSVVLRVAGSAALVLLMLGTSWYGVAGPTIGAFGAARPGSVHAWAALSVVRWFLVLAIAGALLSVLVPQRGLADVALVFGLIATLTLFYRLTIVLPDPSGVLDVKVGGYLALAASAALTLGAYEAQVPGRSSPPGSRH